MNAMNENTEVIYTVACPEDWLGRVPTKEQVKAGLCHGNEGVLLMTAIISVLAIGFISGVAWFRWLIKRIANRKMTEMQRRFGEMMKGDEQ